MMKNTLSIILVTFLSVSLYGQGGKTQKATKKMDKVAYFEASELLEESLRKSKDSLSVANELSEAYFKQDRYDKATPFYAMLDKTGKLELKQLLNYGLSLKGSGSFEKSILIFERYLKKVPSDKEVQSMVLELKALLEIPENFSLRNQKMNTEDSEMFIALGEGNEVYLVSSKRKSPMVKRTDGWTGTHFYNISRTYIDENGNLASENELVKGKVNTKFNEGPLSLDLNTKTVYFSRNNYLKKKGKDSKGITRLKIYKGTLNSEGKVTNVVEMPFNSDNYNCSHPSVSHDGKTLYFSSDMPGGFGGMDIYKVELDKSEAPVNLGEIVNTKFNEVFPYIHKDNVLFLSSQGHSGFGGYDVFVAKIKKSGEVKSIENVGAPVNTSSDDIGFVNTENQKIGFFASNRSGGKGSDDIYGFDQFKAYKSTQNVIGDVKDLLRGNKMDSVWVFLKDKEGNKIDSSYTASNGTYSLDLGELEDDFVLTINHEGYYEFEKPIKYNENADDYKENLGIVPFLNYYVSGEVREKNTGEVLPGVSVVLRNLSNKENLETIISDENGAFKGDTLPFKYGDEIEVSIQLEKDGYVTKTVVLRETLGLNEEINLNERMLALDLTKIEVGKTDLNDVVEINPIYFDFDKSNIREDAAVELDKIVAIMLENPKMVIELGSHTDSRGSAAYNLKLSDRRAKSSAAYIVSQGIDKSRIYGKGYGMSKLKISNSEISALPSEQEKEDAHQENRRTEFIIVKMK